MFILRFFNLGGNSKYSMNKHIQQIFSIFNEKNPNPKTELDFVNNYTFLVAIVLSAQATDVGVNKATKALFKIVDTPQKMLKLGEEGLKEYIKTIGLYNNKAKNIIKLSQALVEEYNGEIPDKRKLLEKLAGVGRKTANVYLNHVYNMPTIAVDTHVFRVSNRLGLVNTKNPLDTEAELEELFSNESFPHKWKSNTSNWLVLHGRYVCKARKPMCDECIVNIFCDFFISNKK